MARTKRRAKKSASQRTAKRRDVEEHPDDSVEMEFREKSMTSRSFCSPAQNQPFRSVQRSPISPESMADASFQEEVLRLAAQIQKTRRKSMSAALFLSVVIMHFILHCSEKGKSTSLDLKTFQKKILATAPKLFIKCSADLRPDQARCD